MNLVEPIPTDIEAHLRRQLQPGELLMVLLSADIASDGQFGESWLALTDERLIVVRPTGGPPTFETFPLAQIQRVRTKRYVGSGTLVVELVDRSVEVVRFSQGAYYKFSSVPQVVEAALEGPVAPDEEAVEDSLPAEAVDHCVTCGRVLRRGTKVCPHCIRKRETFTRLLTYVWPYKWTAMLGLLLALVVTALNLIPPWLNAILIDDVVMPVMVEYRSQAKAAAVDVEGLGEEWQVELGPMTPPGEAVDLLVLIVTSLLGIFAVRGFLNGARSFCLGWLGQRVIYDLQHQVFSYLQFLSLSFYSRQSTGRIMTRVTSDTDRMRRFITVGSQEMVVAALTLVGIGVALFLMNWHLALLALIPTPFMVLGTLLYTKRIHWVFHAIWRRISILNSQLADTIPGAKVVKAFAQENREIARFEMRLDDLVKSRMESVKMRSYFLPAIAFTTSIGSVILWWFGGRSVLGNTLSLGDLQAFIAYMMMFYQPVRDLCGLSEELETAATSAERVFEIIDTEPEIDDAPNAIDPGPLRGCVEFRHVSFTYDGFARILDRVNFSVEPGETIGIVGPSGAGKSTLVNLISRFFDATDGEILIDGIPIANIKQQKLRSQIGVVLQEPLLFQGTIAENIAYGCPDASPRQVIAAARAANAHRFIMSFPDSYDTQVGERGGRLSGGERQRISIARALLGDPRILILDEATSSVDTETEFEIQEALERLISNRTTFAIAHRLSTLKDADRLLVLERGRVVEMGTHEQLLLKEEGVYRRLVDIQRELARVRAV